MTAHFSVNDRSLDLPFVEPTEGNLGVSVAGLRKETGTVTFDPGFMNTAPRSRSSTARQESSVTAATRSNSLLNTRATSRWPSS